MQQMYNPGDYECPYMVSIIHLHSSIKVNYFNILIITTPT